MLEKHKNKIAIAAFIFTILPILFGTLVYILALTNVDNVADQSSSLAGGLAVLGFIWLLLVFFLIISSPLWVAGIILSIINLNKISHFTQKHKQLVYGTLILQLAEIILFVWLLTIYFHAQNIL
ncbi:MAG TPA: hypothetical protein VLF79_02055 [Candidatus Saccharimonadales bacterium]|nr:hypothetical protein [Candidatus Saccharimonadales bacterium]